MGMRVLVVEDDPLIQKVVGRMLTDCTVCVAGTVQEAMEQLELFEFDAVVADLELGELGRDGMWLLAHVQERQPAARRLLISGHHEPLREATMRVNGVIALPKPFTSADLLAAVRT